MFVMNLKTCRKPQKMITIKTFMKVLKLCVILKGCKIMQSRNKVFKQKIPILHLKLQMELVKWIVLLCNRRDLYLFASKLLPHNQEFDNENWHTGTSLFPWRFRCYDITKLLYIVTLQHFIKSFDFVITSHLINIEYTCWCYIIWHLRLCSQVYFI